MKTDELREAYLAFFESKGCVRRPSDVLVPNDPTVLFTPAGMNQFKQQFMGIGTEDFQKATTCQKCLRTGDISNVGVTAYHHTFFEMLGNFSFGDYFKREAIHWAWEFLTDKKWLGLEADRLTVTVYKDDDEASDIWEKEIGLPLKRIVREDEDENFWPASAPSQGPDGVCGPCSEIYFHPDQGKEVEIWNLVFTQFNRVGDPPNNLQPLPSQNIDTGMGLERTAAVLQGVVSNFEIDSLLPLCTTVGEIVGKKYSFNEEHGRAMRRIADHVRAVSLCIHENVLPDNQKQGYVVRQLLRRAVLEGFLLGKEQPFAYQLVPKVVELLAKPYPELKETIGSVQEAIEEEEQQFFSTIQRGLNRFESCVKQASGKVISAKDAFNLHQTDGFLIELTEALAGKHGMSVDRPGFLELMEQHKTKSDNTSIAKSVMSEGPLDTIRKQHGETDFVGYEQSSTEAKVLGLIYNGELVEELTAEQTNDDVGVVLDQSPFYAESGGQVGDEGQLTTDGLQFDVTDTQKEGSLWTHIGRLNSGSLQVGQVVTASVNPERREGIQRAHSATHLLHHALRTHLGEKAQQRGSKVENDTLRFDFSHRQPVTPEELQLIEQTVNARIADGAAVEISNMPIEQAREAGAMALFGEKYPDLVRVVKMGDFSMELCGGTHLSNSGQVGLFKLMTEEPVAKGVRRISALTGQKALSQIHHQEQLLKQLTQELKVSRPEDLPDRVVSLQAELKQLKKEMAELTKSAMSSSVDDLIANAEQVDDFKVLTHQFDGVDRAALKEFADQVRRKADPIALVVATELADGKVGVLTAVSPTLMKQGLHAGNCVREVAKVLGGGGGGRPDMAEAGGKNASAIPEALSKGREVFLSQKK